MIKEKKQYQITVHNNELSFKKVLILKGMFHKMFILNIYFIHFFKFIYNN